MKSNGNSKKADRNCKKHQRKGDWLFAHNSSCCAWTAQSAIFSRKVFKVGQSNAYCGTTISQRGRKGSARNECCTNEAADMASTGDCDRAAWPKGVAFGKMLRWAGNEKEWLKDFRKAWWVATQNGYSKTLKKMGMKSHISNRSCSTLKRMQCLKQQSRCTWTGATRSKNGGRMKGGKSRGGKGKKSKGGKRGRKLQDAGCVDKS